MLCIAISAYHILLGSRPQFNRFADAWDDGVALAQLIPSSPARTIFYGIMNDYENAGGDFP